MTLHINGQIKEVAENLTLTELITSMKLSPMTILVECNGEVIPRHQFGTLILHENDKLELIRFVGGG